MCGITGLLDPSGRTSGPELEDVASAMASALNHRGPDDHGVWSDPSAGVAFGFRRLAIQDLSKAGAQPMTSADGRYTVVHNGEVYNFPALRDELEAKGAAFRGRSDTEVLLAAVSAWGLEGALDRCIGMWAFALWDAERNRLHLVRDRIGEKPLYYGRLDDGTVLFASELKALTAHPDFVPRIDRGAVARFVRRGYVPTPWTIYEGVHKLPPGTVLTVDTDGGTTGPTPYWPAAKIAAEGVQRPLDGPEDKVLDRLEATVRAAVERCTVADVPVGVFLSGGIDSSLVAALLQAERHERGGEPVRTFTVGFPVEDYDEADDARRVAEHMGTDHTELTATPKEALEVVPHLPALYDEPFADSSQIPTFLVSKLAREHVTVALTGDGGDELFGGYNRHFLETGLFQTTDRIPQGLRRGMARLLQVPGPAAWDKAGPLLRPISDRYGTQGSIGNQLHKGADLLEADGPDERYEKLTTLWPDADRIALGTDALQPPHSNGWPPGAPGLDHPSHRAMFRDLVTYLPDDILVKVDRAGMGVSLESRAPLLNHDVVEMAWALPRRMKVRDGRGKRATRRILHRYVPQELVERPKAGFSVPIDRWLRDELHGWAGELLDPARIRTHGLLDPEPVRARWEEHQRGRRNHHAQLWAVLMLEAWIDEHHPDGL